MFLSERIKSLAPGNAVYFRLKLQLTDGTTRVFPPDTGAYFTVGESPYGIASSPYFVCFYDAEYRPISHRDQVIDINLQAELHHQGQGQLNLHLQNAKGMVGVGPGLTVDSQNSRAQDTQRPARHAASREAESADGSHLDEADIEYRRHLHAMDLEERQQEFIKNSTYVTEVGELFALNRLMRREMLELHHIIVQHSQQAYKDIDHVKGTVHELLQLQQAVLGHAAAQIARPPAPPPDYVGLGHSALSVIKEIGVALINRSPQGSGAGLRAGRTMPQLSPPAADFVADSDAPKRADAVDRMIRKLQGMNEVDMAMSMSSPEGWKALLDELRGDKKPAQPVDSPQPAPTAVSE